ncbi:MAG TPA: DUF1990 domain-containing protein [Mycobacteriales bacterium]|nr:DUF1990 domain-containing protein [Mycobacteriales bacterium]
MRLSRTSRLAAVLPQYDRRDLTYSEVGATQDSELPAGYHHTRLRRLVGNGKDAFDRAADVTMAWDIQRGAGLAVASAGSVAVGRTVALGLGKPIGLVIPCRVVYVVDEPGRRGFAYGTLPGHPESGEESFVAELVGDEVWLEITAFSRPGALLVKLLGPLALLMQQTALRSYFRSMRRQIGE